MADLKKAQSGVWFGWEFVPAGTVVPASHPYAAHPAFVDYEVSEPGAPAPVVEEVAVVEEDEPVPTRPPTSGAGSGRDAWVAYADELGVEVTDDMTRDDIINAVDAYEA